MEQTDELVRLLREAVAQDEDLIRYGCSDLGVRVHVAVENDGRALVGIMFAPPAVAAFARLMESGAPGGGAGWH